MALSDEFVSGIYTTGTVTIAADGVTVTGVGTLWSMQVEQGDWLLIGGEVGLVSSIGSDTSMLLQSEWQGTLPSAAEYVIIKMSWLRYEPALTQAKLRELLAELEEQGNFLFTAVAPPDPAMGEDGQWALKTDESPWQLWFKEGGVWIEQASPGGGGGGGSGYSEYEFPVEDYLSIQAAINAAKVAKGGTVILRATSYDISETLLIDASAVRLRGVGSGTAHDGGTGAGDPQTVINWTGAAGGTMVRFKSPFGPTASVINSCGMERIALDGKQLAGTALEVNTVRRSEFHHLMIYNVTSQAVLVTCGVSGTDVQEAADTQHCRFEDIAFRMIDHAAVQNAHGYVLTGTANANTSYNQFVNCGGQAFNGTGWNLINCDNNDFHQCQTHIVGAGTGLIWDMKSPEAYGGIGVGAGTNRFYACATGSTAQSRLRQGSVDNIFIGPDVGNGSQIPTRDANTNLIWMGGNNQVELLLGNYVHLLDNNSNGAATFRAEPTTDASRRFHLDATRQWFGPDVAQSALAINATTLGSGVEIVSQAAGTGTLVRATSSAANENLVVQAKGSGVITIGDTAGGQTKITKGIDVPGDWATTLTMSTASSRKTMTAGQQVVIAEGYPVIGLLIIANLTSGAVCMAWLAGGFGWIINQNGTEFVSGTTPAASKTGIGFNPALGYVVTNGFSTSQTYGVMVLST